MTDSSIIVSSFLGKGQWKQRDKIKRRQGLALLPFFYCSARVHRLFFFGIGMECTATAGSTIAAAGSDAAFMVMYDGVHRDENKSQDNQSYNQSAHDVHLLVTLLYTKLLGIAPFFLWKSFNAMMSHFI
jgi:hypothetical protein